MKNIIFFSKFHVFFAFRAISNKNCVKIISGGGGVHQVMGVCCIVFDIDGMLFEFFSSAVPSGSRAFQMPTRPSSSLAAASTLRGGGPISETPQ